MKRFSMLLLVLFALSLVPQDAEACGRRPLKKLAKGVAAAVKCLLHCNR